MWLTSIHYSCTGRCNVLCIQTVQLYYITFPLYRWSSCTIQYPAHTDGPIVLYNVLPLQMVQLYYVNNVHLVLSDSPVVLYSVLAGTNGPIVLYNVLPIHTYGSIPCTVFPRTDAPVILVLYNAGPLDISWAITSTNVKSIIGSYFPGQVSHYFPL